MTYSGRPCRARVAMEVVLAFSLIPECVGAPGQFLLLGGLSVLLMGAAKAGFAGSVGILSVPIMIYACGGDAPLGKRHR